MKRAARLRSTAARSACLLAVLATAACHSGYMVRGAVIIEPNEVVTRESLLVVQVLPESELDEAGIPRPTGDAPVWTLPITTVRPGRAYFQWAERSCPSSVYVLAWIDVHGSAGSAASHQDERSAAAEPDDRESGHAGARRAPRPAAGDLVAVSERSSFRLRADGRCEQLAGSAPLTLVPAP